MPTPATRRPRRPPPQPLHGLGAPLLLCALLLAGCAGPQPQAPAGAPVPDAVPAPRSNVATYTLACAGGPPLPATLTRLPDGSVQAQLQVEGQAVTLRRLVQPNLPTGVLLFDNAEQGWRWSVGERTAVLLRRNAAGFARVVARCSSEQPLRLP